MERDEAGRDARLGEVVVHLADGGVAALAPVLDVLDLGPQVEQAPP